MRLDVRRIESIKQGDQMLGNRTRVKVVKNKVAPPFKTAEFDIMYGKGISREGDVLDCAVDARLIEKAGSWYSYDGDRIGQGRENVKTYLAEHSDITDRLERLLTESVTKKNEYLVNEDGEIIEDTAAKDVADAAAESSSGQ